ncbi:MAG: carboxymuconolactone decarboxylase family protein [Candidatus Tectomicrobia bacterium]|uniref:Carboxymuconolactone decarboxylase family protein n=1 Tax=Tectimicrobiota bacterium TaxID=2528274 RepID=A0A932CPY1_UNCTE|nr:carboxymuconolactone decarboxylase family protein [Candidatus Tectomicrobia bacterium]
MELLKRNAPELLNAFLGLAKESMKEGALGVKQKELLAAALSLNNHCEY